MFAIMSMKKTKYRIDFECDCGCGQGLRVIKNGNQAVIIDYIPKGFDKRKFTTKGICLVDKDFEEFKKYINNN